MSMTRWSSVAVVASVLGAFAAAGGCASGLVSGGGVFADGDGGSGEGGETGGGDGDGGDEAREDEKGSAKATSTSGGGAVSSSAVGSTGSGLGCDGATQFTCSDGTCVAISARCNGVTDCFGNSDEMSCGSSVASTAVATSSVGGGECPGELSCGDGTCVPLDWQCDGEADCFITGADEVGCPCDGFACNDGECIPDGWECDDYDDCLGGEDEADCGGGGGSWTCNPEYYGTDDGCDCGCGELDPDCFSPSSSACDFCTGGCGFSCDDIDPSQNWLCY